MAVLRWAWPALAAMTLSANRCGCSRIGERVRSALREAAIPHALNLPLSRVTASLGGAVWRPSSERLAGPTALIEAADRAL
jgi:PleD family two-component response regulator